jgi:hypothetical protein
MTAKAYPCDELPLELLLSDGTPVVELEAMTDHLGNCQTCQSRLAALAAAPIWWNDTKQLLHCGSEISWQPDASWWAQLPENGRSQREALENAVQRLLSAPSHPELLGRLGRYDVERIIGSGGMGIVLKAHDSELNRPIAIKVLASHLSHVGAARDRFAREGRAAAAVVHEHVVAIYNVESGGEVPFLVMQYVPGRSLQSRIDDEGPLAVEEILRVGMQAASGLAAAHAQGLVHRDVKPSNILLEETVERAVLTDFGLARAIDDASLTHTGVLAGTPHYMSPEQATGDAIDHRSDLFSLGAVLYFMATGRPPFRADSALGVLHRICHDHHRPVWHLNNEIPDDLSDLIDQLLAKAPNRRPADAEIVGSRLAEILSRIQLYGVGRRRIGGLRGRLYERKLIGTTAILLAGAIATAVLVRTSSAPAPTAEPPNQPSLPDIGKSAAQLSEEEQLYAEELGTVLGTVQQLDGPAVPALPRPDGWRVELESLKDELARIELEQGISP